MRLRNGMHIGKLPPKVDPRTLPFSRYRTGPLPIPPDDIGDENLVSAWPMGGNGPDPTVEPGFGGAGDCVFAGGDNETLLWTTAASDPATFNGKTAISDYSAVTGYVINDPSTDNGTDILTALNYRRKTGLIDINGVRHKIGAFVALDVSKIKAGDFSELYEALYLFEAVAIGIEFPASAMTQFDAGEPWDVVADDGGIEGGHYVPAVKKYATLVMDVVTWTRLQKMTKAFLQKYCDELYAILSPEMLKNGASLEGYDLASLQTDLAEIDNAPPTPPTPTPTPTVTITVTPATASIPVGSTVQLAATDQNGSDITSSVNWQSADEDVATVNQGLVTAIAPGVLNILAIDGDASGEAIVTVTAITTDTATIVFQVGSYDMTVDGVVTLMDERSNIIDSGSGGRMEVAVHWLALGLTYVLAKAGITVGLVYDGVAKVATLTLTMAELAAVMAELAGAQAELAGAQAELAENEKKLAESQKKLSESEKRLSESENWATQAKQLIANFPG